jgi:hypothetical protein
LLTDELGPQDVASFIAPDGNASRNRNFALDNWKLGCAHLGGSMRRLALLLSVAGASLSAQTTQQVETPLNASILGGFITGPFAAVGAVDRVGNNLTVHFNPSFSAVFLESGEFFTSSIPQFTTGLAFDFSAPDGFSTNFAFQVYNSIVRAGQVAFVSPDPGSYTIYFTGFGGGRGISDTESSPTTASPVLPLVGPNQEPYSDYFLWAIDIVSGTDTPQTGDVRFSNIRWISDEPVTATPEPGELLLTATSLLGIAAWSSRKRWMVRRAQ